MNNHQIEDRMYEYKPLERWEVVMLLVNYLRCENSMSKERAKEVIAENTKMIPCMTGGELPADEIMIKEVEGVQLNCRFIGGWVDLSEFPAPERKKIVVFLDGAKEEMHLGAWYVLSFWRNWMRRIFYVGFVLAIKMAAASSLATPVVANVTAHQRYPWNGLVDIAVTIQGGGTTNDIEATKCTFTATNFITKASIPMVHVIQDGRTMGAGGTWELKYIWDAKADVGSIKIDDIVMTVNAEVLGVQLWENGPYWAECNIGAESPEEYGYYFWWGDTVGCCRNGSKWDAADGSQKGVLFKNCPTYTGKSNLLSIGYIDSIGKLVAAHDAATEYLGAPWRMPTRSDFDALIGNCTKEWAVRNGVYGLLVKGRGAYALRSIFLPAADKGTSTSIYSPGTTNSGGYYWSSSTSSTYDMYSYYMQFGCGQFFYVELGDYYNRCYGFPVRPLIGAVD